MAKIDLKKVNWISIVLIIIASIISIGGCITNGFPLVHQDSGFYIYHAYNPNFLPPFRPFTYSLLIKNLDNLWAVILIQGFIGSYLIYKVIKALDIAKPYLYVVPIVLFLALNTGYSYNCSQLMADSFTPFCILTIIILLIDNKLNPFELIIITVLFIYATMMHFSHGLMNIASLAVFTILYLILNRFKIIHPISKKRYIYVWIITLFSLFSIHLLNYIYFKEFVGSKNSHAFFMARLVETEILKEYLYDNCGKRHFKLCDYKDKLSRNSSDFIWADDIIHKTDGILDKDGEYKFIIKETFKYRKYIHMHLEEAFKESLAQLITFDIGDEFHNYTEITWPFNEIKNNMPKHIREYSLTHQYLAKLDFEYITMRQYATICISLFVLFFYFFYSNYKTPVENSKTFCTALIVIIFVIINAGICGSLSGVYSRYQTRIIWIIPLIAIIVMIQFIQSRIKKNPTPSIK